MALAGLIFLFLPPTDLQRGAWHAASGQRSTMVKDAPTDPIFGLREIADAPHPELDVSGLPAQQRNRTLPFARAQLAAAQPFSSVNLSTGSGLTALQCLAQAVYYEAAHEPFDGRRAVAQVVLNRLRHPAFAKSVCGVVYQGSTRPGCQFSFTCDGSLARRPAGEPWAQARQVALEALNGHVETKVGLATHYHANYVFPYWAPRLVKLAQIGAHIFYRWPGNWGKPSAFAGQYVGLEVIPAWRRTTGPPQPRLAVEDGSRVPAFGASPLAATTIEREKAGRLDVMTSWRLHVSDRNELNRSSSAVLRRQAGENSLLDELAGATDETS